MIQFADKSVSLVPDNWMISENHTFWPPKRKRYRARSYQKARVQPQKDWEIHKITKVFHKKFTYEQAKREEKQLSNSSSLSSDSDANSENDEEEITENVNAVTKDGDGNELNDLNEMWQQNMDSQISLSPNSVGDENCSENLRPSVITSCNQGKFGKTFSVYF